MMLLYRGTTDAEKGFMAYLHRRKIPVKFTICDGQADNGKIAACVQTAKTLQPDLIYSFGTTVTAELVGLQGQVKPGLHVTDIPVVFDIVADPIGARLISDMKSSGRNLTGVSHLVPLAAQMKALQSMRGTRHIGVLYNPQEKNSLLAVQELERIAPQFDMSVQLKPVALDRNNNPSADGLHKAVKELLANKPQFVYIPSDSFLIKNAKTVVQAANLAGIPVFAATEAPIRNDGALLGLVSNYFNVGEFAGYKAEQILVKKIPPSQIPVDVLHRFTYLVNMTTAKKLRIYPPAAILKIAEAIMPLDAIDARE
ncbi:ABC transporter substrate-binding protein [Janthinobacterium sp. hw3]|uniref:ABC transporter substrate-binding protein n=2 Tax=Janthinobacterium fluminis TaxID=2987524 RepID=A0ABT5K209_9BURK|nr:ABC transporter substrate-binding protein [Janthinobacterium fluminis]